MPYAQLADRAGLDHPRGDDDLTGHQRGEHRVTAGGAPCDETAAGQAARRIAGPALALARRDDRPGDRVESLAVHVDLDGFAVQPVEIALDVPRGGADVTLDGGHRRLDRRVRGAERGAQRAGKLPHRPDDEILALQEQDLDLVPGDPDVLLRDAEHG